jgi:hypothetical protein
MSAAPAALTWASSGVGEADALGGAQLVVDEVGEAEDAGRRPG